MPHPLARIQVRPRLSDLPFEDDRLRLRVDDQEPFGFGFALKHRDFGRVRRIADLVDLDVLAVKTQIRLGQNVVRQMSSG